MTMTTSSEIDFESLDEEGLLDDICIGTNAAGLPCGGKATMKDALGQPWCPLCQSRCDLINWGKAHGWTTVESPPYTVGGQAHYLLTATFGTEDSVLLLLAAMEVLEREGAA